MRKLIGVQIIAAALLVACSVQPAAANHEPSKKARCSEASAEQIDMIRQATTHPKKFRKTGSCVWPYDYEGAFMVCAKSYGLKRESPDATSDPETYRWRVFTWDTYIIRDISLASPPQFHEDCTGPYF